MKNEKFKFLKQCRISKNLSLKDVFKKTGITDSRMNRVEKNNSAKTLSPEELRTLAQIYDIPIVEMLIQLNYLEQSDLNDFQLVFKGVLSLDEEEKKHIQKEIDFINRKRGVL